MLTRATCLLFVIVGCLGNSPAHGDAARPNVVLIMTDDQGIGDFGAMGNQVMETPHLDTMAHNSAAMTSFYVSPVCSPTRACLMTGRYNYRTRCIDTWLGRSMMDPEEVTVAEVLSGAGYTTGIFGKWHLGDCYPMRPIDQGFDEALVLRGGGLAQPADPPENEGRYTNPVLFHNGTKVQTKGYCTDVYFDAALQFIEKSDKAEKNFFAYVATNAPHGPYHDVPEELRIKYMQRSEQLAKLIVPQLSGQKLEAEIDRLARIAAMITNIDQNVGRLFEKLDQLGLTENTLVIFLTDNGPNTRRYVGKRRGMKTEVHEGGVRTPLWMHWPARLKKGTTRDELAAHIDLMPTILDACGVAPHGLKLDGLSILPLLEGRQVDWSTRTLVIQSQRGDTPTRYHNFMIRSGKWKLLHASGFSKESFRGAPNFELYDLATDPRESENLIDAKPEIAQRLKTAYDQWFDDVSSTRPDNYAPPRIWIGTPHEEETVLTRQDWRGGTWAPDAIGVWQLHVATPGTYDVEFLFAQKPIAGQAELAVASQKISIAIEAGARSCRFDGVPLTPGNITLGATLKHGQKERGILQAIIKKQMVQKQERPETGAQ